mgnify:CR=1 FL=1
MSLAGMHRKSGATAIVAAAIAFVGAVVSLPLPARADIVPLTDQLRGIAISQETCEALPRAVFVSVSGRDFCMRYYLSVTGGAGNRPVVFLQGDRLGPLDSATGEFKPGARDRDLDTRDFNRIATLLSQQNGAPAIYLARPGLDGSSGDHRIRHTSLELNAIDAALDAIKRRHRFAGFHVLGQSGGSSLIGGLLGLRSDIGCAVIGAGLLSYPRPRRSTNPAADYFNAIDAVNTIAQLRNTRILLVTDPGDRKVPERLQTEFALRLKNAGGQVEQFLVQATDNDRHAVLPYARTVMTHCLRNASTEQIGAELARQIEASLAAKSIADAQQSPPARDVRLRSAQ